MRARFVCTVALALVAALTALAVAGCAPKNVTVQVVDADTTTDMETQVGKTVGEALASASIEVGDKDTVTPGLDSKIAENMKEIVIKRHATVTIKTDAGSRQVEVTGGTVGDALNAASISLAQGATTDPSLTTYVKDGMTITVSTPKAVTVSVDGAAKPVTTSTATVQALLAERNIKIAEGDKVEPGIDAPITEGMTVTVATAAYAQAQTAATEAAAQQAAAEAAAQQAAAEQAATEQAAAESYDAGAGADTDAGVDAGDAAPAEEAGVVSRTTVPNCNNDGHGYYEITYSDGTVAYEEY